MHRTLHRVEFGRWHHQVRERATALFQSQAQQLQWLQARDVEERSELVSKFGESTLSLGQVTHEVYTSRDAHWTDVPKPVVT